MSIFQGKVLREEPVLISGLVQTVLALLLAFGVTLTQEQVGSIMAVVAMVVAIAIRMVVTPNSHVPDSTTPAPPADPTYPRSE